MNKEIFKVMEKVENSREKKIVQTSIISIGANILLVVFKAIVGLLSNSVAIISDAINNFSDALSSIITIIGTKLAGKPADKKHPYGYGRIEYMTSLIISAIVLYAGVTALVESIKKIIHPEDSDYSTMTLVILIAGIVVKFLLGIYVKKVGKKVNSDSLVASGSDAFNDAILSISVLLSAIVFMVFHISLEAYVGAILSIFIIKAGLEMIQEAVDNMLGIRVESDLSQQIKKEIAKEKEIQGVFDLVLNNYGPDKYLGSVHIEVPDTMSVSEVDRISRKITKEIMQKYGVILHTIGIYSINTQNPKMMEMRNNINKLIFAHEGVLQMHGFYVEEEEKRISFDIIIDFEKENREAIYQMIFDEIQKKYPEYQLDITLDVDVSD